MSGEKPTTKNDVELAKVYAKMRSSTNMKTNIKNISSAIVKIVLLVSSAYVVVEMLHSHPDVLKAVRGVLKELKINEWVHICYSLGVTSVASLLFLRNRHLVARLGEFRHKVEDVDVVKTRSGLNKFGIAEEDGEE